VQNIQIYKVKTSCE